MATKGDYLRVLPQELPKPPDISHLFRAEMIRTMPGSMAAADKRREADRWLAWALTEAVQIRRSQRQEKIDRLRTEVKSLGLSGRYPKHLWAKLRDYEAAQAADGEG